VIQSAGALAAPHLPGTQLVAERVVVDVGVERGVRPAELFPAFQAEKDTVLVRALAAASEYCVREVVLYLGIKSDVRKTADCYLVRSYFHLSAVV